MNTVNVLTLPFPPSVNHYWRYVRGRVLISAQGRHYRKCIAQLCLLQQVKTYSGDIYLHILVYPPDRRRRDLDNLCKSLLDALQHSGLYHDDFQICTLHICRMPVEKNGKVIVSIRKAKGEGKL